MTLTASELLSLVPCTSVTPALLLQGVFMGVPLSAEGAPYAWKPSCELTVREVLATATVVRGCDLSRGWSGRMRAMVPLIAEMVPELRHQGILPLGQSLTSEQEVEFQLVVDAILAPVLDHTVEEVLVQAKVSHGFQQELLAESHAELREALAANPFSDIPELIFEGSVAGQHLQLWAQATTDRDRDDIFVMDFSGLAVDKDGQPSFEFNSRGVHVANVTSLPELICALDSLDQEGLELGAILHAAAEQGMLPRDTLANGQGLVHLQSVQIRADLQRQGSASLLVAQALRSISEQFPDGALNVLVADGWSPRFPSPEHRLPIDIFLEAQDEQEQLTGWLGQQAFLRALGGPSGQLISCSADARARGTNLQQLLLLADLTA